MHNRKLAAPKAPHKTGRAGTANKPRIGEQSQRWIPHHDQPTLASRLADKHHRTLLQNTAALPHGTPLPQPLSTLQLRMPNRPTMECWHHNILYFPVEDPHGCTPELLHRIMSFIMEGLLFLLILTAPENELHHGGCVVVVAVWWWLCGGGVFSQCKNASTSLTCEH